MEKGEVGIVGAQFVALVIVILILGNFAGGTGSEISTPLIGTVYWGGPSTGVALQKGTLNTETTNATTISVYYTLAYSTTVGSVAASRLCHSPDGSGQELIYTKIPLSNDSSNKLTFFTFSPVGQPIGLSCHYTVSVTDSLQQVITWTGTVVVKGT